MERVKKKKILLIDDEVSTQEMIKDFLSISGFNVIVANDGKEGIQKIYDEYPDLILLDWQLPKMDGKEVISEIRKDPLLINKPVIMLTVRSSEEDQIKGLTSGVDDYVIKPFNRQVLLARIKAILERKELSINTNPLTRLPGNIAIYEEVKKRISSNKFFVFLYIDLANFKSFNDYYGFEKGDEVIKLTANILLSNLKQYSAKNNFIGHIGGDDFVIITDNEDYKMISEKIINDFDNKILSCYSEEDRKNGYIVARDRQNNLRKYPIITISIVCVSSKKTEISHYGQISKIATELKQYARQIKRSVFVEERRKE